MEKLFDDAPFVQKERPTKITEEQEQKMYLDLAAEIIKNQWAKTGLEECIAESLSELSINDSGFEKAKDLEDNSYVDYDFCGDFINFLDDMSSRRRLLVDQNVKLWVKAHNPQPKLEKGTKLKIDKALCRSKDLLKDSLVYVTGINMEKAYYTISANKEQQGGYVIAFEEVENNCTLITE